MRSQAGAASRYRPSIERVVGRNTRGSGRLFGIAARLVSVLVLAIFAAGFLARLVPPSTFWIFQLAALGLGWAFTGVVCLGIMWLVRRRWRWAAVHGLFVGLYLFRLYSAGFGFGGVSPSETDLTIITQNLPSDLGAGFDRIVETEKPDIFGMQETYVWRDRSERSWSATPKLVPFHGRFGYVPAVPEEEGFDAGGIGQPVFALEPTFGPLKRFGDVIPLDRKTFAVRIPFEWQGRTVVLYNVHLASYRMGSDRPWNNSERWFQPAYWRRVLRSYRDAYLNRSSEVEKLVQSIRAETDPVIVMGDFNDTMHNWTYGQLSRGMTDAFLSAGSNDGATFSARNPIVRIDFILVSDDFEVVTAKTLPETTSDHRGVLAQVRFTSEPLGPE